MKCDELKAYNVVATADVNPEVVDSLGCTEWAGYDKSEVDAAIAELEESHKMEVEQLLIEIAELKETLNNSRNARKYWRKEYLIEYKECSYQKYKRCLAMAMWCYAERDIFNLTPKVTKVEFFARWHKRWLEIATKFEEHHV